MMDAHRTQLAAALRDLADHIEAGRIAQVDVKVDYGIQETQGSRHGMTSFKEFEPDGFQTITIVAHGPRTLSMPGLAATAPKLETGL